MRPAAAFLTEKFHKKFIDALLCDLLEGILAFDPHCSLVKCSVLFEIGEDQSERLLVHTVPQQNTYRLQDLPADNKSEQVIFVLKMIIKSDTDDARSIRDLLDRYLFKRYSLYQIFQAFRKGKPDVFSFFLHTVLLLLHAFT